MNHAMLQRIVEEVAARLRRRARSTATLSVAQLGEADIHSLLCQHASLRIVQGGFTAAGAAYRPARTDGRRLRVA
ncbi:propanediol utilization protein PduM [Klebsiella aerogenes]|nr:propanediol utilization protein PduM [Klebsiella aerogenes]